MNAFADGPQFLSGHAPHGEAPRDSTLRNRGWRSPSPRGSIGGDIEKVNLNQLQSFYGKEPVPAAPAEDPYAEPEPTGSNGMAIAPSNTADHHSLLLINPHTSFFFRSELQMTSDEGLNAYGAATWGQFFIYQGFNEHAGWMHTSSGVDAVDEYLETVTKKGERLHLQVRRGRALGHRHARSWCRTTPPHGHGRKEVHRLSHASWPDSFAAQNSNGKWVAIRLMQEPIKALTQSYTRAPKAHEL